MSHYAFNWFAVPPALTALFSLAVGLFVLRRDWTSQVGRALFLATLTITVWLGASAVAFCSRDQETALLWTDLAYIGVPLLPAALSLYVLVALRLYQRIRVLVWAVVLIAVVFTALAQRSDLLISGVVKRWWGYYPSYGPAGVWFLAYYSALIVYGLVLLAVKLREAPKGSSFHRRIQISLLALVIVSGAGVDFLAKFGRVVYPCGYVAVLAFLLTLLLLERRHLIVYMTPAFAAQEILATMQGAVLVTGLDGTVEMSNQAAERLLGYREAELMDLTLGTIFAPDADWRGLLAQCAKGERVQDRQMCWRSRGGGSVDVSVSASPLREGSGRTVCVVFVALDITQHKLWEQALATEKEHLARLNEAAIEISRCLTVAEVQRVGVQLACKATGSDAGVILQLAPCGPSRLIGNEGLSRKDRGRLKRIVKSPVHAQQVLRSKASLALREDELQEEDPAGGRPFTGVLVVPVLLRGIALALLCLGVKRPGAPFDEADRELAEGVAALMGVALENARLYDDARYLSQRDPVTGLLNHRGISALLDKELARCERSGGHFAVVMMDLDNFKLFNDTYGHVSGDHVLQHVSGILTRSLRRGDSVGRYGGDEFLALLPDTDTCSALHSVQRVKKALDASSWSPDGAAAVPLCMSYGIATYPFEGRHISELLAAADANLYLSKGQGGNCVTSTAAAEGRLDTPGGIFTVLDGLVTAVDGKDHYTRKHSDDVCEQAVALAAELGLSDDIQKSLRIAGLLHDVGKIGIPDRILRKPGSLSEDEFEIVKQHVGLGELIIKEIPNLVDVLTAVGCHHERYDGRGYPRGLKGEEIPLLGRILAVADAYSAMTTDRPYRKAFSPEEARTELRSASGTQLDPKVVAAFIALLQRRADLEQCAGESSESAA